MKDTTQTESNPAESGTLETNLASPTSQSSSNNLTALRYCGIFDSVMRDVTPNPPVAGRKGIK